MWHKRILRETNCCCQLRLLFGWRAYLTAYTGVVQEVPHNPGSVQSSFVRPPQGFSEVPPLTEAVTTSLSWHCRRE
jgi:hypothetical protein